MECNGRRDPVRGTSLECVFGNRGEIQRFDEGARLVVACEYQQSLDEPLGVNDRLGISAAVF
jgi:hypothetical protein